MKHYDLQPCDIAIPSKRRGHRRRFQWLLLENGREVAGFIDERFAWAVKQHLTKIQRGMVA